MKTMTYSQSRARYAETLNQVVDDREEIVITRAGRDPVNARRLLTSIDRLEHGGGVERDLLDDSDAE